VIWLSAQRDFSFGHLPHVFSSTVTILVNDSKFYYEVILMPVQGVPLMLCWNSIKICGQWDDEDFVSDFPFYHGTILVAETLFSHTAIDTLLSLDRPSFHTSHTLVCPSWKKQSLSSSSPIIADFLSSQQRCDPTNGIFDNALAKPVLLVHCINYLDRHLRQNICT